MNLENYKKKICITNRIEGKGIVNVPMIKKIPKTDYDINDSIIKKLNLLENEKKEKKKKDDMCTNIKPDKKLDKITNKDKMNKLIKKIDDSEFTTTKEPVQEVFKEKTIREQLLLKAGAKKAS